MTHRHGKIPCVELLCFPKGDQKYTSDLFFFHIWNTARGSESHVESGHTVCLNVSLQCKKVCLVFGGSTLSHTLVF